MVWAEWGEGGCPPAPPNASKRSRVSGDATARANLTPPVSVMPPPSHSSLRWEASGMAAASEEAPSSPTLPDKQMETRPVRGAEARPVRATLGVGLR